MKRLPVATLFLLFLLIPPYSFAFAGEGAKVVTPLSAKASDEAKSQDKAADKTTSEAQAAAAEIENLKAQIAILKETKEISEIKREVDALKSDLAAHIRSFDWLIKLVSVWVSLLVIVFGLISFKDRRDMEEIKREAKETIDEVKAASKEATKEAKAELVEAVKEAKAKLGEFDKVHDQLKQKSSDVDDLVENIRVTEKEMTKSGVKPSAEIVDKLKQDYDNLSNEFAAMRSKASAEKDEFSATLIKQLSALKESAQFLERQGKPLPASYYFNLGYEANESGKHEDAIKYYSKVIEMDQNFAYAYNNRGVAKAHFKRYEEAVTDYNKAIELRPDDDYAYSNRGNAKGSLGLFEEAIADYDKALQIIPDNGSVYFNRGIAKGNLGRYEEAIADYDKAIELKPDYVKTYQNKAEAQICLSKFGDAETTLVSNYSRFVQNEDKAIVLYLLLLALASQGKDDSKAQADYQALLKDNPRLIVKEWDHKHIDAKLVEIEQKEELPTDWINKMKAIHAEFKKLDR